MIGGAWVAEWTWVEIGAVLVASMYICALVACCIGMAFVHAHALDVVSVDEARAERRDRKQCLHAS